MKDNAHSSNPHFYKETCAMSIQFKALNVHTPLRRSRNLTIHFSKKCRYSTLRAATPSTNSSTVSRGTSFEKRCLNILETHLGMVLRRVGGKEDGGVDLTGWWWLPDLVGTHSGFEMPKSKSSSKRVRILAQCKAEKKKVGPKYVRELEGVVWSHMAAENNGAAIVAVFLSESPFTQSSILRAMSSRVPFLLVHVPPSLAKADDGLDETISESTRLSGSCIFNPALGGSAGLFKGQMEVRWCWFPLISSSEAPQDTSVKQVPKLPRGAPMLYFRGQQLPGWVPRELANLNEEAADFARSHELLSFTMRKHAMLRLVQTPPKSLDSPSEEAKPMEVAAGLTATMPLTSGYKCGLAIRDLNFSVFTSYPILSSSEFYDTRLSGCNIIPSRSDADAMRFVTLFALAFVAVPTAVVAHNSKPSSTPGKGWSCPEVEKNGLSKIERLCDNPPHANVSFGCTYYGHTSSTSTLKCVYDVDTGKCTSANKDCPESALDLSKRSAFSKRAPAAPVPASRHYARHIEI
ncbi:hypothetical protein D9757_003780 [Collybiopsis confluens]|uniref:Restriction endonuclease type IV Mrr domain-containing protein n=1 Tax=Collybiopsis confluens TaxID=2823264 RepID=A0A8H5HVE3_9AGAR|nr:hypothetical protein D9757_003780 [Collybiopsis confluens]